MSEANGNDRLHGGMVTLEESLRDLLHTVSDEIRACRDEMTARFDAQATRLGRQDR